MLPVAVLQTTDMFTFVCLISYIPYSNFCNTCHFKFTIHDYDLNVISGGGGDDGWVTGKEAAEPLTALQEGILTTEYCAKPLDIFPISGRVNGKKNKKKIRYFWWVVRMYPAGDVVSKPGIFFDETSPPMLVATKTAIFSQNIIVS